MGRTFERAGAWNTVRGLEWAALVVAALLGVGEAILGHGAGLVPPAVIAAVAVAVKALRAVLAVTADVRSSTVSPASWAVAVVLALVGSLAGEVAGQKQEVVHEITVIVGPDVAGGAVRDALDAAGDPGPVDHLGGGDPVERYLDTLEGETCSGGSGD